MEVNKNHHYFECGDEIGSIIKEKNWSNTTLGDPADWPKSLCMMVSVILNSPIAMCIAWGKNYTILYNKAFNTIISNDNPSETIGTSYKDLFSSEWHQIKPKFDTVMKGSYIKDTSFNLSLNKNGELYNKVVDFIYSPIKNEDCDADAILITALENISGERNLKPTFDSENIFRTLADNIPNLAWMADADGWIYWYNKKWYEYTGTTENEMEGWGWQKVHDPQELPKVLRKWKTCIAEGEPFEMVFPIKGKNEQYRHFLTRVSPMFDDNGNIYQWFGSNTDITEQKLAEIALKESEARFRNMAENTNILISVGDETRNATYFNKAWEKFTGRAIDDLINFGWVDLIHEEDRDNLLNQYFDSFNAQEDFKSEFRILNKQGEYRWLITDSIARRSENERFEGYISCSMDITDIKNANEIIKVSELRFRSLTESIPQLVWETDNEGKLLFASNRWEQYTGVKPGIENEWKMIVHPDDYDKNAETWSQHLKTGEIYKFELRLRSKTGDYRWYSVMGEPVFDEQKVIKKWVGAFTDIHNEKNFTQKLELEVLSQTNELAVANDALKQKNDELQKMNKELQSFAYISSHDLQEPLRKIQIFSSQIVKDDFDNLSETAKEKFGRMQNAAKRMQILIEDLLSYSRTNISERKFEKIDLSTIINEVKDDLSEELQSKRAVIINNSNTGITVIAFQFKQLIYNLISNAIKFAREGVDPVVEINSEIKEGHLLKDQRLMPAVNYCHLQIIDNGIGFEEQYSEAIFNVFQRLHGKEEYAGTGIGLAIVKKIVENHNGIISASSELEKGATFDIYIPELQITNKN